MEERKVHRPNRLGLFMNRLPKIRILYPLYRASKLYRTENTLYFEQLPAELDGLRVVFAADIHYGAYLSRERVLDLAARMNAERGDLILLGGDFGEDTAASLALWREIRPCFEARMGAYAVPGNHDLTDPDRRKDLAEAMADATAVLLTNRAVDLPVNGGRITLAGVDDIYMGAPSEDLLEKECEGKGFTILLTHSPDVLPAYFEKHEKAHFDLVLCGHTHGGQIAVAGKAIHSSSRFGNRYNMGQKNENGATILITQGVGTSMLPIRWGTKPEYHVITLRKK